MRRRSKRRGRRRVRGRTLIPLAAVDEAESGSTVRGDLGALAFLGRQSGLLLGRRRMPGRLRLLHKLPGFRTPGNGLFSGLLWQRKPSHSYDWHRTIVVTLNLNTSSPPTPP